MVAFILIHPMSIPLDRLYHYIEQLAQEAHTDDVIIYRFFPHGSKKIQDLNPIQTDILWETFTTAPTIHCHDQEPLNYDLYPTEDTMTSKFSPEFNQQLKVYNIQPSTSNLRINPFNIYDKCILIHSEQNSANLEQYKKDQFITVYYWSHALISLDWFRYAEHVKQQKQIKKTFLIYNRAWSGTREYRLKFLEFLIRLGLHHTCQTSVNPIEPELGIHYELHKFKNPAWRPQTVLEKFFPISDAHSHYSADFDIGDYEATDIEVVLETLFDDSRLHLTEKSLRPIACGQPFILAGTHGSLEYLRSYGFKTFGDIWDEHYDLVENPEERLIRIADLMRQIANWDDDTRENKMSQARIIAEYNQQHFFSKEFFNLITNELQINLASALTELETTNTSQRWFDWRKQLAKTTLKKFITEESPLSKVGTSEYRTKQHIVRAIQTAKKYQ